MHKLDIYPSGPVLSDDPRHQIFSVIGGIVQHLDLQALSRIIQLRHRAEQPFDRVLLIKDGKLDSDRRPCPVRVWIGRYLRPSLGLQV